MPVNQVSGQVSRVGYRVSVIGYQVSGIRYQVSGVRCQMSGVRCQLSDESFSFSPGFNRVFDASPDSLNRFNGFPDHSSFSLAIHNVRKVAWCDESLRH